MVKMCLLGFSLHTQACKMNKTSQLKQSYFDKEVTLRMETMCQERQKDHPFSPLMLRVVQCHYSVPTLFLKEKPIFDRTKILSYGFQNPKESECRYFSSGHLFNQQTLLRLSHPTPKGFLSPSPSLPPITPTLVKQGRRGTKWEEHRI